MKILLTGASGFVGSHILDSLRARRLDTVILLRPASDKRFITAHLPNIEVRSGSIDNPVSLEKAMTGVTHVIHCAGATKARHNAEFYQVNQIGTRNVVSAANAQRIKRLIHISSLAAAGPALPENPAREDDVPQPVSEYGRSKLGGEIEVRQHARSEFVILRPPAIYGPRDLEFLKLFKAVKSHLLPKTGARQALSLAFVKDLAEVTASLVDHPAAAGKTWFVAARETVTATTMAEEIAAQMNNWTVSLPVPTLLLWPVCLVQQTVACLAGRASVLSLQKYAELRAPGWVCDPSRLEDETGQTCPTTLRTGIAETLAWYREHQWL